MAGTAGMVFGYEAQRRLRVAFLGTSGHGFRNFLPSLPYAPVELVGLWDDDRARGEAMARTFGAAAYYAELDRLFDEARPEAVLIAAEPAAREGADNALLMARCLERGCHAWTDKPLASSAGAVRKLIASRDRAGRVAAVGVKTMYYPAHQKVREIVRDPSFGRPVSIMVRYPLHVPQRAGAPLDDREVRSCLGHLWHPFGASLVTLGTIERIELQPAPAGGGGVALATFRNAAAGVFHFAAGQAGTSPLERLEVIGEGANVVVENATRVTYYRKGSPGPYGRTPSYLTGAEQAPLAWEPELTLGQLYNTNSFIQGYAQSIMAFVAAAMGDAPLLHGTLEDGLEILKIFEALRASPGQPATLPADEPNT
jgi:predicted dehydrogenase